ncbi:MAG TPA: uroporphyrinogen-III synthase [Candidatus Dormibacteraeota bacterium]|nr:uroporphyrinogen-III synthase [Candidatus Dormibacteraeota bacterium]
MTSSTLLGRRILVTRASHQAEELMVILRGRGADPVSVPVMVLEPLLSDGEYRVLGEGISSGRWDDVVFTSANAVRLALPERSVRRQQVQIFAIGPGTAGAARKLGWRIEPLPASFIAESLAEQLITKGIAGRRVLLPRAVGAREVLPEALGQAGAEVEAVDLYRMRPDEAARPLLEKALAEPGLDCIVFASGSSVECFRALRGESEVSGRVLVACIGPITAQAAETVGLRPGLVTQEHSLAGLVTALELRLGPVPENGRQP